MERITQMACMAGLCVAAAGASAADRGFYFGVLGGQAQYDFEAPPSLFVPDLTPVPIPSLRPPGEPVVGIAPNPLAVVDAFALTLGWPPNADDESNGWGALVGYRVIDNFGVELSYLNLGALERREQWRIGFPVTQATLDVHHELETKGPALSMLGILPIGKRLELYARAGVFFADMELSTRTSSTTVNIVGGDSSITFGSDAVLWGAGAQVNLGRHWSARLDFQRFDSVGKWNEAGKADIDFLSVGVLFRL